ncbi:MAG TPA: SDR family oxidoreductase [Gemmatimonadaceae bacterium]|nr:SDR family oxidoreductase [Gemmatimonadaceae bacterium]
MTDRLRGRVALVTGATRGIGLATARALVAEGAYVAMLARSAEALRERASEIGDGARAFPGDITDAAVVERTLAAVRREVGEPDILVNNAGVFEPRPVEDVSPEDFARTVNVNLVAAFALVHTLLPAMRAAHSGHIVTIGSVADRTAFPGNSAYAASKFGLRALHEVLRNELRGSGVRASLVSPGPTDTPIWDAVERAPSVPRSFPQRSEMMPPDAVASAVLYALTLPAEVNVDELRLSHS